MWILGLITSILVLWNVSCGSGETPPPPAERTLHLAAAGGPPTTLNPLLMDRSISMALAQLMFNSLVRMNEELAPEPDLAQSWEISPDGLAYTFHLRPNVRFHDGVELTSADVAFTYDLICHSPVNPSHQAYFTTVARWETPDKYTFRAILKKPFGLTITSMCEQILPKHLLAGQDMANATFNRHPIGSGPFRFKEWTSDDRIILERNGDYYEGKPQITQIIARGYETQSQLVTAFLKGKTDVAFFLSQEEFEKVKRDPQLRTYSFPYIFTYAMEYNLQHPLFQDKNVRTALASAVNIPQIIGKMEGGYGEAATGPFIPQTWWFNPDVKPLTYNPAKAQELLAAAGWRLNEQNILTKDGQEFRFTLLVNPAMREAKNLAMCLHNELFKLGIRVELQECNNTNKPPEDAAAYLTAFCIMPDPAELNIYWSSLLPKPPDKLWAYYKPEINRLLDAGKRLVTLKERQPIYRQLHQTLYDDQPALFLYFNYNLSAVRPGFTHTDRLFSPAMPFWTIKDWEVTEDIRESGYQMEKSDTR